MPYEYYKLEYIYREIPEEHSDFQNTFNTLIIKHLRANFRPYLITFEFTEFFQPSKFRTLVPQILRRFYAKFCTKLSQNIFQDSEKCPILYTFVDRDVKSKLNNEPKLHTLDKPHLHGILLIHEDYIDRFINLNTTNKFSTSWRNIKISDVSYNSNLNIKPIEETKEDLERTIDYITAFMKNPEYSNYLEQCDIPYTMNSIDSKALNIKPITQYQQAESKKIDFEPIRDYLKCPNFKKIKRPKNTYTTHE